MAFPHEKYISNIKTMYQNSYFLRYQNWLTVTV